MTLDLARYTTARVSLGRAGSGLPTRELLDFQLAHAQARDAVRAALDVPRLLAEFQRRSLDAISLHSAAADRGEYLRDPGRGRTLGSQAAVKLAEKAAQQRRCDVAFVLADGLSAVAVDRHALPVLDAVLPLLLEKEWPIGPVCVVEQGRVAIGDSIGATLNAEFSVVLIGERPGLSSPDSLGVYITWHPRPGRSDAERNCISNIRPEGLPYAEAAHRLMHLLQEAQRLQQTGVGLKDGASSARLSGEPAQR